MTHIALCITDLNVGGAERCLVELATRLDRNRFTPVAYCLTPAPLPGEPTLIPVLQSAGLEVECLGARNAADFLAVVVRLAGMLRRRKTQIVQTLLFHANLVGRIAAWHAGVPHVVCGIRVAQRQSPWRLRLDRMTHRMVDRYVCVSQSVADFSVATGRLPADKLVVIPNGIDLPRFTNVPPADRATLGVAGRRLVTFIGRLDDPKGAPAAPGDRVRLAEAVARLRPADRGSWSAGNRVAAAMQRRRNCPAGPLCRLARGYPGHSGSQQSVGADFTLGRHAECACWRRWLPACPSLPRKWKGFANCSVRGFRNNPCPTGNGKTFPQRSCES